jgi:uncharacterized membrane-anchored protein YhcB (DUF1043 family)
MLFRMKTLQAILVIGVIITCYLVFLEAKEFQEQMSFETRLNSIRNQ